MVEIVKGSIDQQVCAESLVKLFKNVESIDGEMYIGYPIFSTTDGKFPIDAILVIPSKGVVIIKFFEGTNVPEDYKDQMDDVYSKLKSKLQGCKALVAKRELAVNIKVVVYAPGLNNTDAYSDPDYTVCNNNNLLKVISGFEDDDGSKQRYKQILSVLQSITTLRSGVKKRVCANMASKGAVLHYLEDAIATLDHQQSKAVIESVEGVQRIRGLAGSGKTVVLALKAAYLHARHPDWKIAVTFHTRSLKEQFKRMITSFVIEQASVEPDWENLKIIHAWGSGAGDREGMYYDYCAKNNIQPLDYGTAKDKYGLYDAFIGSCREALVAIGDRVNEDGLFDAILVDEAQDLPVEFLRICYNSLRSPKRLVYAYDELQSLTRSSLPSPEEIFGNDEKGFPRVQLRDSSQDITLSVCYRNSGPVLSTAHALGFGIYREPDAKTHTGLVQMFDDKSLWDSVGYSSEGVIEEGSDVSLYRNKNNSPEFLESKIIPDEMMIFKDFVTEEDQAQWVASEIIKNIHNDELRPDDILVINPDPLTTRRNVGIIRAILQEAGINSHLVGIDTTPDVFFRSEASSVTFSGVFRAKGNEAGMVYIINAQDCFDNGAMLATVRNRLFTAITRSKAWVRVLGVGEKMKGLIKEYQRIRDNGYKLRFKYPTSELRAKIRVVNRDKSTASCKAIDDASQNLSSIIKSLNDGVLHIEDLDKSQLDALKRILDSQG